MEISVLQGLIDRTSNKIAGHEQCIRYDKCTLSHYGLPHWEVDSLRYSINWHKQRLPKLRKIQKALKKEIGAKIALNRAYKQFNKCVVDWGYGVRTTLNGEKC